MQMFIYFNSGSCKCNISALIYLMKMFFKLLNFLIFKNHNNIFLYFLNCAFFVLNISI